MFSIQCYDCIRDHKIHQKVKMLSDNPSFYIFLVQSCPGELKNYPKSYACRISTLGESQSNKIVEQTVTPVELCDIKDIQMFKLRIAKKYRVGDGKTLPSHNALPSFCALQSPNVTYVLRLQRSGIHMITFLTFTPKVCNKFD